MRISLLLLTLLLPFSTAEAFDLQACIRAVRTAVLPYAVENYTNRTLKLKSQDGVDTLLALSERIGVGDRGGVYRVRISGDVPLIAKIPHSVRITRPVTVHPEAELEMQREVVTDKLLKEKWSAIEKDPLFPKDPAWEKGQMPSAPIVKVLEAKVGTVLLKPQVSGETLEKLYAKFEGKLPLDMKKSVDEIYAMTKAITNHVKTPVLENGQWKEGRNFLTDVNPANLVWVSEPEMMKVLGLKRPSFVFYEITPLINRQPQYLF